jgi:hypothetical protein
MRALPENFKGIEFVRISSLPKDQQEKVWSSLQRDKVIKILKDKALMNDCILYNDYVSWLKEHPAAVAQNSRPTPAIARLGKLAFE